MNESKNKAIKYLKSIIKPNTEILIKIDRVSSSGLARKMSVYVVGKVDKYIYKNGESIKKKQNDLIRINYFLQQAEITKLDKNGCCIVNGAGMDMAFALTYNIKIALYGYKVAVANQQYKVI